MKTTQSHFIRFKKAFCYWQKELGLLSYKVTFEHVYLEKKFATIGVDEQGKIAVVSMTTELVNAASPHTHLNPELHGKHECIHLLLSKFSNLAFSRFIMERELYDEEEAVVRVLEKALKDADA